MESETTDTQEDLDEAGFRKRMELNQEDRGRETSHLKALQTVPEGIDASAEWALV